MKLPNPRSLGTILLWPPQNSSDALARYAGNTVFGSQDSQPDSTGSRVRGSRTAAGQDRRAPQGNVPGCRTALHLHVKLQ